MQRLEAYKIEYKTINPLLTTLSPAPPPVVPLPCELDLAYLRLRCAQSDEELREALDLIAKLQAQDLTNSAFRGVKNT